MSGYPEHLSDPRLDSRLAAERGSRAIDPVGLLHCIADEKPADAEARITALLERADIFDDLRAEHAIVHAYSEFPAAVGAGLLARIAADLPLPYRAGDYLKDTPPVDSRPLVEAALDPSTPQRRLNAAAAVIGPATITA